MPSGAATRRVILVDKYSKTCLNIIQQRTRFIRLSQASRIAATSVLTRLRRYDRVFRVKIILTCQLKD